MLSAYSAEAEVNDFKIKKCVSRVKGLKILGRVGTHILFNYFFILEKI